MTDIHAGISQDLAEGVREAQMRGEEQGESSRKDDTVRPHGNSKGKGKEVTQSSACTKAKVRNAVLAEDEENTRRRGETAEPESDPESDWIPGPVKSPKPFTTTRDNIFGIKGLRDNVQVDTTPEKIDPTKHETGQDGVIREDDDSVPFITVPAKRAAPQTFNVRLQQSVVDSSTATPELLKFSSQNPFSPIQLNNQTHPLLKEFSWTWEESETLHDADTIKDGPTKSQIRKRMASDEFEERRKWELKKFKKTGYDMSKYNRGDFGPRTGIARL
jgi:ubiquitin-conjugating enzyme E2 S